MGKTFRLMHGDFLLEAVQCGAVGSVHASKKEWRRGGWVQVGHWKLELDVAWKGCGKIRYGKIWIWYNMLRYGRAGPILKSKANLLAGRKRLGKARWHESNDAMNSARRRGAGTLIG